MALLLISGAFLRIAVILLEEPVSRGYVYTNDSTSYLRAAQDQLFGDALHPAGYPLFLRALDAGTDAVWRIVLAQHVLGLLTAVLLYLAVRRIGAPKWVGLIPAAVVIFDGDQIFLEHAVLSDTLFGALLVGALYALAGGVDSEKLSWPLAGGRRSRGVADLSGFPSDFPAHGGTREGTGRRSWAAVAASVR